jgi:myosin protein heavy chain
LLLGKERRVRQFSLAATAFAIVIGRLQSQADAVTCSISGKKARSDEKDQRSAGGLVDLQVKLEVTTKRLADAMSQQNDLQSQVAQMEFKHEEWSAETELLRNVHQDSRDALEQAEARLAEVAASLEEVESERNSLTLQLTNLQTDFSCAQQEVAEAESRYSHLQFHQLSSMSSNEVIRSLRAQIEELEMRVLRRTEQIGIHQHDIKRLETNMRLQEDRVGEMTVELETLSEQKEAMVEDCADAREARDEAKQRAEALEEQLELLEGKLEMLEEQRKNEVVGLVGIVFETVGHSRNVIMAVKAKAEAEALQKAEQADEARTRAHDDTSEVIRQTTLALAVCQHELSRSAASVRTFDKARTDIEAEVGGLREKLEAKAADAKSLSEQLTALRVQHRDAKAVAEDLLLNRTQDLETTLQDLQRTNEAMEISYQEVVQGLLKSQKELQGRLAKTEHMLANNDLENVLEQFRAQHAEALTNLQKRLDCATNELDEARQSLVDSERLHQQTLDVSVQSRKELETRLLAASDRLQAGEQLEHELTHLRTKHVETVVDLQAQLDSAVKEAQEARESYNELQSAHQMNVKELARATQDYELAQAAEKLLSVQSQLDDSTQRVLHLDLRLRDALEYRDKHKEDLYLAREQAESIRIDLREELVTTKAQLEETRLALASSQEEKGALQIEVANVEAQVQRSKSVHRFLESQVKDRSVRSITCYIRLPTDASANALLYLSEAL